jgi:hypothetical protein
MDKYQTNDHSSFQTGSDEDFELMTDIPRDDPVVIEVKIKFTFFFYFHSIIEFLFSVVVNVIMK